jgi:hypothetical protein
MELILWKVTPLLPTLENLSDQCAKCAKEKCDSHMLSPMLRAFFVEV